MSTRGFSNLGFCCYICFGYTLLGSLNVSDESGFISIGFAQIRRE